MYTESNEAGYRYWFTALWRNYGTSHQSKKQEVSIVHSEISAKTLCKKCIIYSRTKQAPSTKESWRAHDDLLGYANHIFNVPIPCAIICWQNHYHLLTQLFVQRLSLPLFGQEYSRPESLTLVLHGGEL